MKIAFAIIGSIVALVALGVGAFVLAVALSGPVGQGNGIIQKNSAENWTQAQARFETEYAGVIALDRKIEVAATALAVDPTDPTLQTNHTGVQNACISAVALYNAEARKFLSADFRAADLPDQINGTNPATDCK